MSRMASRLTIGAVLTVVMAAAGALAFEQTTTASPPSPAPVTPQVTVAPAPQASQPPPAPAPPPVNPPAASQADQPSKDGEASFTVYMPDGQLKSHSIRVYVSRDIQPNQYPKLTLLRSHAITSKTQDKDAEPLEVAPAQEWSESVDGQQVRRTGTLLLFDLSGSNFGYKAMVRVTPVVKWTEGQITRIAIGKGEVNVGNIVAAVSWTLLIVAMALLLVILLSWRRTDNPLLLLTGVDGHLSLGQTQIACWTVAVGGVVLGYGLIRLEIPTIPGSLIALMGASLATGGVAFFQDAQKQQAAVNAGAAPVHRPLALGDLVRSFTPGQEPELSLAKAQMLFWTVLLLVLFISKSILDGAIWDIPWALVALMGFSQAGYLAPKVAPQP